MAWLILIGSAVCEAVWATALAHSQGLTVLFPSVIFFIGLCVSMLGLGFATKTIPISVAYSVWVGIGAVLTAAIAFTTGTDTFTGIRALLLAGIIVAVIGLKIESSRKDNSSQ
ncbi:quaternary ammonium compound-resistance protein SugE [Arcanobacterium pluranimalium]|uniref:DMT family transporter n=1 Tax=Arcanobacterium pluranimalium TaxID=108028 RepID=UPI00195907DC|nr:SMR family transporter [Arcanobacterium pluranimalium]MBM7825411.1 quaternary ammonium compound-resistance protein SugE [Arcanobacterium pluranimalium]